MAALEGLGFAVDWFDRGSYRREDPVEVARLRARQDARTLLIARDMPVLRNSESGLDSLFPISEIEALGGAEVEALLGLLPDGAPIFVALLADEAVELRSDASDGFLDRRILVVPGREDLKLIDLRSIAAGGLVRARPGGDAGRRQGAHALARASPLLRQLRRAHRRRGGGLATGLQGLQSDPFPAHRSGRHHARGRRGRLRARPPAPVPEGHVFGAGRIRRAGRDDRGRGQARDLAKRRASSAARSSILLLSHGLSRPR